MPGIKPNGVARLPGAVFDCRTYGASGGGTHDDTAGIQAAVAAAEAAGGGVVQLPPVCRITGTISQAQSNVVVQGPSTVYWAFDGDLFSATPGFDTTNNAGLVGMVWQDFAVVPTAARASGRVVYCYQTSLPVIQGVTVGDLARIGPATAYDGFYFDTTTFPVVRQCYLYMLHHGIVVTGVGTRWMYDGVIDSCELWGTAASGGLGYGGNTGYGIWCGGGVGGLQVTNSNVIYFLTNIQIDTALTGAHNDQFFFGPNSFSDSAGNHGINVAANSIVTLALTGGWFCGCGQASADLAGYPNGAGVNVASQSGLGQVFVNIVGNQITSNRGSGVACSASAAVVQGNQIRFNGAGTNGGDGITLPDNTAANFAVSGNVVQNNGNATRGYGVGLGASAQYPVNVAATGNVWGGNGQGDLHPAIDPARGFGASGNAGAVPGTYVSSLASPYTFTAAYANTGLAVALPAGGTYGVRASLRVDEGNGANQVCKAQLLTDSGGAVANSERLLYYEPVAAPGRQFTVGLEWADVTVTGATTVRLQAFCSSSDGSLQADSSGRTQLIVTPRYT